MRVNVWKEHLARMGLAVGPWLKQAKEAVWRGNPDDTLIVALCAGNAEVAAHVSLGELRDKAFRIGPGQSFAYVVDAAYHAHNASRIVALARNVDTLFIETVFLEDRELGALRCCLTAAQDGSLAREEGTKRLVPFHFSPRYLDRESQLRQEASDAFAGIIPAALPK